MRKLNINEVEWPRLLNTAKLQGSKVVWSATFDLDDQEIIDYNEWKKAHKINVLNAHQLKRLHTAGHYVGQIFDLFKKNKRINYLAK